MTRARLLALVALLSASGVAVANSGIPGPIMWAAGSLTVAPLQWMAVTMVMCVAVEAAFFHYSGMFKRPIVASALANIASLIVGIPLAFLGAIDPTRVVLATVVSIICEGYVLKWLPESVGVSRAALEPTTNRYWRFVIIANVVTNLFMIAYLAWIVFGKTTQ
jgi:hypothetical protein